jgi:hypothetical protein
MIQRRAKLDGRAETVLGWRQRVAEMLSAPLDAVARSRVDPAYDELRGTLRQARGLLSDALASVGDGAETVPRAGRDPRSSCRPRSTGTWPLRSVGAWSKRPANWAWRNGSSA